MLDMCRHLGFAMAGPPDESGIVRAPLPLGAKEAARGEAGD